MASDYNLTYHSYFVGEDECREGVSARTVRSGGTAAASAAAATAPEPAPATTATTTTWPVNHPPCWLPNESRARDEPTKYQPRNARPSCTVPTLSSPSSSSTRVNVPTALVALFASSDRGNAQSSERERTQKRDYATGYTSRQIATESWK